jgi:hypothetical protein
MGLHLGAALVFIQKLDDGRGAVRTGLTLNPPFAIRRMRRMSDDATFRAQSERIRDGMRMAGYRKGDVRGGSFPSVWSALGQVRSAPRSRSCAQGFQPPT